MRVRLTDGVRRRWRDHPKMKGLVLERDIPVGSLYAKMLVFKNRTAMRRFWREAMDVPLGRNVYGVSSPLAMERFKVDEAGRKHGHIIECDPRYFTVIGLVMGHLDADTVAHEATHGGFNFARRKARAPWDVQALDFDEEGVAYPTGVLTEGMARALRKAGL